MVSAIAESEFIHFPDHLESASFAFRLTLRQTADILHRYEAMDRAEHSQILALSRDGKYVPIPVNTAAGTDALGGSRGACPPGRVWGLAPEDTDPRVCLSPQAGSSAHRIR